MTFQHTRVPVEVPLWEVPSLLDKLNLMMVALTTLGRANSRPKLTVFTYFTLHSASIQAVYAAFMAGVEAIGRLAANDKDTYQSGSAVDRLQKGINVYLKVTYVKNSQ